MRPLIIVIWLMLFVKSCFFSCNYISINGELNRPITTINSNGDDSISGCLFDITALENALKASYNERLIDKTEDTLIIRINQEVFNLPLQAFDIDSTKVIVRYWY